MRHDGICLRCCFCEVCSETDPCDDFAPAEENDEDLAQYIQSKRDSFIDDWDRYLRAILYNKRQG